MTRVKGWLIVSQALVSAALVARVVSLPRPRLRGRRDHTSNGGGTLLLEPEPELTLREEPEPDEWPLTATTLGPDDDEGGPTSYYRGEVDGITQVLRLMHNIAAGRKPDAGFKDVPKRERVFEFGA